MIDEVIFGTAKVDDIYGGMKYMKICDEKNKFQL
jgi:hypothetical protein